MQQVAPGLKVPFISSMSPTRGTPDVIKKIERSSCGISPRSLNRSIIAMSPTPSVVCLSSICKSRNYHFVKQKHRKRTIGIGNRKNPRRGLYGFHLNVRPVSTDEPVEKLSLPVWPCDAAKSHILLSTSPVLNPKRYIFMVNA